MTHVPARLVTVPIVLYHNQQPGAETDGYVEFRNDMVPVYVTTAVMPSGELPLLADLKRTFVFPVDQIRDVRQADAIAYRALRLRPLRTGDVIEVLHNGGSRLYSLGSLGFGHVSAGTMNISRRDWPAIPVALPPDEEEADMVAADEHADYDDMGDTNADGDRYDQTDVSGIFPGVQ
jgi:hypothetical protein